MVDLINALPQKERQMFREYGLYTQNISMMRDDEKLFQYWNANKQGLYQVLGQNFILKRNVVYAKDISEITQSIRKAFYYNYHNSPVIYKFTELVDKIRRLYNDKSLSCLYIGADVLAENKYTGRRVTLSGEHTVTNKPVYIQPGMKIIKMMSTLMKAFGVYDAEEFEAFRQQHSVCLNDKSLSGELCLSIHPLDYATMSDNQCDWTSCMSWEDPDGGEYRVGTIEMMNSPYVVVAYLESHTPMSMPYGDDTWSNKKWRELFVVSPEIIMGIQGYPYPQSHLEKYVLDWLKELVETNTEWGSYLPDTLKVGKAGCAVYHQDHKIYTYFSMNHMYNDIYRTQHHPAYLPADIEWWEENRYLDLNLSGPAMCLSCGAIDEMCDNSLVCHECGGDIRCSRCGEYHSDSDDGRWISNDWFCYGCIEQFTECENCGRFWDEWQSGDKSYEITPILKDETYFTSVILCQACYDNLCKYDALNDDKFDLTQITKEEDMPECFRHHFWAMAAWKAWFYKNANKEDLT